MKSDALSWLESLAEKDLYPLLQELLFAMGFQRALITHGPLEYGRDLVFMEIDKVGREIWRCIQVKAGATAGSLTSQDGLRSIVNQCEAALDTPFILSSGESIFLQEIWLVCTYTLTEQAKNSIAGKIKNRPPLFIIDGQHLAELLISHLPSLMRIKSKPVEIYLDYLLRFCNSIDEYIKLRMTSRFTLTDVYVEQRLQIRLLPFSVVRKLRPLDAEIGVESIIKDATMLARLGRNRLLPAALHLRLTDMITRIEAVMHTAASMRWPLDISFKTEELRTISEVLGVEPFGDRARSLLPSDYKYECEISVDLLKNVEEEIVTWGRKEEHRLPKLGNLIRNSFHRWGRRGAANPLVRTQFLSALEHAYRSSIDTDNEWTEVAIQIARLLAAKNEILTIKDKRLENDIERLIYISRAIQSALKAFQNLLLERLNVLWSELGSSQLKTLRELSQSRIDALVTLEQITRLIERLYSIDQDAYVMVVFDAFDLCESIPRLILVGDLGVGKTTLIKQLAKRIAENVKKDHSGPVPVLCRLTNVPGNRQDPLPIRLAAFAEGGFSELDSSLGERTWWLLDGFDEIQSAHVRNDISDWLNSSVKLEQRFTLTSRPFALSRFIPGALAARVLSFSELQIEEFINRFPWAQPEDREKFLVALKSVPELLELAHTPLLLTLIVVIAQAQGPERIPTRREGLYHLIIDLFMGEWDIAKGLRKTHAVIDEQLRFKMLRRAAYNLYAERMRSFSREEFVDSIMSVGGPRRLKIDEALQFFSDLLRDCLVIPISRDRFGFFHLSIHEYLAAMDMCDDPATSRVFTAIKAFIAPGSGGWWEEVLVFYAAIKRDISAVVEELHEKSMRITAGQGISPDFLRLLKRMIDVADFTDLATLRPKGIVAAAFHQLNVGNQADHWRKLAQASSFARDITGS